MNHSTQDVKEALFTFDVVFNILKRMLQNIENIAIKYFLYCHLMVSMKHNINMWSSFLDRNSEAYRNLKNTLKYFNI